MNTIAYSRVYKKNHILFSRFVTPKWIAFWALLGILQWGAADAFAFQLTLAWNKNPETNITGYTLYYGLATGQYTSNVDVGNQTSYTVSNLTDGKTYYFAVTAYNSSGESGYSNEVQYVSSSSSTNHAPVASNLSLSVIKNNTNTAYLSATDADGDSLVYSYVILPAHGTLKILDKSTGKFSYTPNTDYTGSDSFTFKASDGSASSNTATVSITVRAANHAPVANNDSAKTVVNQSVTISVLSNDTDADGDTLTVTSVTGGSIGTPAKTTSGNAVIYTSNGSVGTDTFTYTVSDGNGGSATGTVTVTVTADTSGGSTTGEVEMALNVGGGQRTGSDGTIYQADTYYSGGTARSTSSSIDGTTDDVVYQSYRYGTFAYSIPVANGSYNLTLKFAELSYSSAGQRVFNVYVEDSSVATNVDVFAAVGRYQAYDIKIPVTVSDGYLDIGFEAVSGNPMLSGILLQKDSDLLPQNGWSLRYADSQELVGEDGAAVNAFDDDPSTFWHTEWYHSSPGFPHEIQINLGGLYSIKGFRYLPRQDGDVNGRIMQYRFYVSTDGINWGTAVASGSFANDASEKEVTFTAKSGRYVRLNALSEVNGNPWASAAEIRLLGQ